MQQLDRSSYLLTSNTSLILVLLPVILKAWMMVLIWKWMKSGSTAHEVHLCTRNKFIRYFICLRRLLELGILLQLILHKTSIYIQEKKKNTQPPALPPKAYSDKILYRQKKNKWTTIIEIGERKNRQDICGCYTHRALFNQAVKVWNWGYWNSN